MKSGIIRRKYFFVLTAPLLFCFVSCQVLNLPGEEEENDEHSSLLLASFYFLTAKVRCAGTQTYQVRFSSTWSAGTHGTGLGFPTGAHYSLPVGVTHSSAVSFGGIAQSATAGIENMAELGGVDIITSEFVATSASDCAFKAPSTINPSPGEVSWTFPVSESFPLVTLLVMLAPSPDWFTGTFGTNLRENGQWVDRTVDLYAWDAGTDSGTTFLAADQNTSPAGILSLLAVDPFFVGSAYVSVGKFFFTRQ